MAAMDRDVFDTIVEQFVREKLDDIIMQDAEYVRLQDKIWEETEKCNRMALSETQRQAVENLVSLHIKVFGVYGKKAYGQGFRDCVSLLKTIGVMKEG